LVKITDFDIKVKDLRSILKDSPKHLEERSLPLFFYFRKEGLGWDGN
jgi:hypothetical protein